jgi:beta-lactamase regulating signal transducer with metallopeptidase domain
MSAFPMTAADLAMGLFFWSWQALLLLALVWIGLKIARLQSAALRHKIWLLALITVTAMPMVTFVARQFPGEYSATGATLNYAVQFPRLIITTDGPSTTQAAAPSRPAVKTVFWSFLFLGWTGCAAIAIGNACRNARKFRQICRQARSVALRDLECEGLCAKHATFGLSMEVDSPILFGLLRPVILLPADIAKWTSAEERRAMISHELAHLERRDQWINLFQITINTIFFFHPMVRYAGRQLSIEREIACDDFVLGLGTDQTVYAESLLKSAERSLRPGGLPGIALISAKQLLERRIEMIVDKERVREIAQQWRYGILFAVLIAVVAWLLIPGRVMLTGVAQRSSEEKPANGGNDISANQPRQGNPDLQVPPPPPPPPPPEWLTVEAGKPLQPMPGIDDNDSVFSILREIDAAQLRRDISVFERVLDENYQETGPNGETLNKAQTIAQVKRLDFGFRKIEFDDLLVNGNETMAVATFLCTAYFQKNGQDSTVQFRYTVNFIKMQKDSPWKVMAIHATQRS